MILQRSTVRLAIPTIPASAVWATALAAILTLTAFGCQSGEQRQANELREALVQLTDEIEQLNQEEIAAWRERKEVVDTSPPPRKKFQSSSASIEIAAERRRGGVQVNNFVSKPTECWLEEACRVLAGDRTPAVSGGTFA